MRAVVQTRYGSPEDLEIRQVPAPPVGEGEVRVRVKAASLHPDVWHVVTGRPRVLRLMGAGLLRPKNPIPGTDMAGTVESSGEGVTSFGTGEEVFGETIVTQQWMNGGAFAELVSVPERLLARKPANVTFEEAASVPTSGYIVLLNLRDDPRLGPGHHVLVNGAGGGVGMLALQIAKARGARVTAVDTTRKLDLLRSLGADEVVDFTREDYTRRGVRYDLVLDVPGDRPLSEVRPTLDDDGRYVPIGHDRYGRAGRDTFGLIPHFIGLMIRARFSDHLRGPPTPPPTRPEAMEVLRRHLEAETVTPVVDSAYPLENVREAFRHMIEDETLGKVVLVP